jgi:hypothetical protein
VKGALAGVVSAGVWAAAEPVLGRAFGSSYSDVRLLGRLVTRRGTWPLAGVALHVANGAAFGWAFERLGLRGVRQAVLAAEVENLVLWPGFVIVDRIHPDRRDGTWPRLASNARVAAYEVTTHALFGIVLGRLVSEVAPAGGPAEQFTIDEFRSAIRSQT